MARRKFLLNREDYPVERKKAGRPRGPSAQTLAVKDAVRQVANRLGGVDALYKWATSEPHRLDIFWSRMYMQLLPIEIETHLHLSHEEILDELERRFPRFVGGRPVKYLEGLKAPHVSED